MKSSDKCEEINVSLQDTRKWGKCSGISFNASDYWFFKVTRKQTQTINIVKARGYWLMKNSSHKLRKYV